MGDSYAYFKFSNLGSFRCGRRISFRRIRRFQTESTTFRVLEISLPLSIDDYCTEQVGSSTSPQYKQGCVDWQRRGEGLDRQNAQGLCAKRQDTADSVTEENCFATYFPAFTLHRRKLEARCGSYYRYYDNPT